MDLKLKEGVVVEFLTKEAFEPKEIHNRLNHIYGLAVMDTSDVRYLVKKFVSEETEIRVEPRSGRPHRQSQMQIENVLMN